MQRRSQTPTARDWTEGRGSRVFRSSESRKDTDGSDSADRLTGRVNLLTERIDTLAQTVATTASAIAKKDGELAIIRRELDARAAQVDALSSPPSAQPAAHELDELRRQIAAVTSERARSSDESRLGRAESKLMQLAERIDTLATTVATTAAGLAGREGEIAGLRRALDEMRARPAAPAADTSVRALVDDLGAATASAAMRIEGQASQLAELRDAFGGRISGIESAIAALGARVERAERERAALASSVAEAAAARWRDLERTLTAVSARVESTERERDELAARLERLTSLWPTALRSLEARVDELAGTGAARLSTSEGSPTRGMEISRLRTDIRAVEEALAADASADLPTAVATLTAPPVADAARPGDAIASATAGVLPFRSTET
jgi:chromosome segregation ATPase